MTGFSHDGQSPSSFIELLRHFEDTQEVLSRIASWSAHSHLLVGLWCSPLIALALYVAQEVLGNWLSARFLPSLRLLAPYEWLIFFMLVSVCAFWLACGALTGLCAAFFWRDVDMDAETRRSVTLRSVAITWVFTFPLCCMWIVLGWPYLAIFRFAVERGIPFWNSNRPREWIGDFSDMEASDQSGKENLP